MELKGEWRNLFPLKTVNDVRKLFEKQLATGNPDLALLSIVAGTIENTMTKATEVNTASGPDPSQFQKEGDETGSTESEDVTNANLRLEPQVEWHLVEALYIKFDATIRGYCDVNLLAKALVDDPDPADLRKLIKHVADIVWNTLSKAQYKDRPHLQSIYSYLTGNKLDCFGVAFAVVAGCQLLKIPGVHLALSEDHAWVVFGKDGTETAEVTWHGKGNEDKRGQPVEISKAKTSWLYLAGQPVVCDRAMEVAALVSSINYAINSHLDSIEVAAVQQELLWLLYDNDHLKAYPMALGNLGDLEEINPTIGRTTCLKLYEEAVAINQKVYNNHHVYPYTYLGGFFYRMKQYSEALEAWANAADVIKLYRYSKDDEEIYKEFMEIANELIPHVMKSADTELRVDPKNFARILRFYDGICQWEEGSATPILHIGWAKPMVTTCSKFEQSIRQSLDILEGIPPQLFPAVSPISSPLPPSTSLLSTSGASSSSRSNSPSSSYSASASSPPLVNNNYFKMLSSTSPSPTKCDTFKRNSSCDEHKTQITDHDKNFIDDEESESINDNNKNLNLSAKKHTTTKNHTHEAIDILSELCQTQVLNLDYLLGKSRRPFVSRVIKSKSQTKSKLSRRLSRLSQNSQVINVLKTSCPSKATTADLSENDKSKAKPGANDDQENPKSDETSEEKDQSKVVLQLNSAKMAGLKDLLLGEKLNTSAIQLQLTALSQTNTSKPGQNLDSAFSDLTPSRPKRSRLD